MMNKLDASKEHMKTLGLMTRFCMVLAKANESIFKRGLESFGNWTLVRVCSQIICIQG